MNIFSDNRYFDLVKTYRHDYVAFAAAIVQKKPTWQQRLILNGLQEVRARVSVASGHGTGKSDITSIIMLAFLILNPESRVVVVANNAQQVRNVIWKYLKLNFKAICHTLPWLPNYFGINEREFFAVGYKGVWSCISKSGKKGNAEGVAGEHCHSYLIVIDEASGVDSAVLNVLDSALTEPNNNMLMISQPTRSSGFFYDSHHKLKKSKENPLGIWNAISLNSEESPLVTSAFIQDKLIAYGGEDNPEYQIKILGRFPDTTEGFLISRSDCERAAKAQIELGDNWGWLCACDVGNGRDKSVINIMQVSLDEPEKRKVKNFQIIEMSPDIDPIDFAHEIKKAVEPFLNQNIKILVDGDGIGFATVKTASQIGLTVEEVRWGFKPFANSLKDRFANLRAYAHIMLRDAIKSNRLKIDSSQKTKEQISRLPAFINDLGQWQIMRKEQMRSKLNLKSPDRSDTYCFAFLADVLSASEHQRNSNNIALERARKILAGEEEQSEEFEEEEMNFEQFMLDEIE